MTFIRCQQNINLYPKTSTNPHSSVGLLSKAMVALMAMLFQNGTVGTTGPAMWLPGA